MPSRDAQCNTEESPLLPRTLTYKLVIIPQVRGRSAGTVVSKLSTPKSAAKSAEVLVPKEYDVIEEVINLLGRMESDRLSTQDALVKERERVQKLRDEIDAQAYKRMHDLPLAVQRGKYSHVLNFLQGDEYFSSFLTTFHLLINIHVIMHSQVTCGRSVEIARGECIKRPYYDNVNKKESKKLK